MSSFSRLVAAAAGLTIGLGACFAQDNSGPDCLYASVSGESRTPVVICQNGDPLELGKEPLVLRAMKAFDVDPGRVRFIGCSKQIFKVMEDQKVGEQFSYIVFYPTEAKDSFLAPIIHELAHVVQMDAAGGQAALLKKYKSNPSKRIELGADFLTGVLFNQEFPDAPMKEFEQNQNLYGQYFERHNEHGKPEERAAAFTRGITAKFSPADQNIKRVSELFQRSMYGDIVLFSQ